MKWCADCRTRFLGWFPPQKKTFCAWHCSRRRVGTACMTTAWVNTHTGNTSGVTGRQHRDQHWLGKWCGAAGAHSLDSSSTVESSGRVETTSSLHQTLEPFWLRRLCCLCSQNAIRQTGDLPSPQGGLAHCLSTVVQTLHMQPHRGCSTHNSNITWITSQS